MLPGRLFMVVPAELVQSSDLFQDPGSLPYKMIQVLVLPYENDSGKMIQVVVPPCENDSGKMIQV